MDERYDAIVVGGGPAGGAAAFRLARAGWSVVVLERKAFPRRKVCGEYLSATNLPILDVLGLAEVFRDTAGPEIYRVGLFVGRSTLEAPFPRLEMRYSHFGRAMGRERLDALLLERAATAGAHVLQPWTARDFHPDGPEYVCRAEPTHPGGESAGRTLRAPVVIAAHGSWDPGALSTQPPRVPARPGDVLAFKAHFRGDAMPAGMMPLLGFPGGYGGMVHCDGDRLSTSFAIRRDRLAEVRRRYPGLPAGEAVCAHVMEQCRGAREALTGAERLGEWLAAGPLRPGFRPPARGGVFAVGNAAGEAHPAIAEGISMALQSAWLLADRLIAHRRADPTAERSADGWGGIGRDYAAAWRRNFAPRLRAAAWFAHAMMRPTAVATAVPVLRAFPQVLAWAARLSGKAERVVG